MIVHNKLVRDRIPEIIAAEGRQADVRVLDPDDYLAALQVKLAEEVDEYRRASDPAELADVLEVAYALATAHGLTPAELDAQRADKRRARGAFDRRLVLTTVS